MEKALRNRLTFGPLMLAGLGIMLWLDWAVEQWAIPWQGKIIHIKGLGLLLLMLFVLPPATVELATLFTAKQVRPYRFIAALGSIILVIHAFLLQIDPFRERYSTSTLAFIIAFVMMFAALRRAWGKQTQEAIVRMAGTVLSLLYLGGLSWFLMALRVKERAISLDRGDTWHAGTMQAILMILLVVKFTDIGAFFGGRALGRHKLIPWLSPGKTWEGLVCGMLTSGVVGLLFASLNWVRIAWWEGLIFGIVIGGIGQAGDLLESLMKRDAEVKDSGRTIPGFGGILDVIDSPLFAAPFAYLLFSIM